MKKLIAIVTIITLAITSHAAWPVHLESGSSCGAASDIEASLQKADAAHAWGDHATVGYTVVTGSVANIPFVNTTGDEFDYSSYFKYASGILHSSGGFKSGEGGLAYGELSVNGLELQYGWSPETLNRTALTHNSTNATLSTMSELKIVSLGVHIEGDGGVDASLTVQGDASYSATTDMGSAPATFASKYYVDTKTASARGNLTMVSVDWSASAAGGFEPLTNWTQTASHNVTLSSTGMVIDVAGWYDIDVAASFSVANNNTDPICQLHTNGVAVPYIGWQRTITSSAKGVVSGAGHIYIASNTLVNAYIDTASTDTTYTFLTHSLRIRKIGN